MTLCRALKIVKLNLKNNTIKRLKNKQDLKGFV